MNIGFEAKRAFVNDTGLGQYSRTLITSLADLHQEHEYYLFTPKVGSLFSTKNRANMHTILPDTWAAKKWPSLWRSRWVTKDIVKNKVDLFHGLSHEIPAGLNATGVKSVVTIHDLIHERFPKQYSFIDRAIYSKKFRYACQHANHIIAISKQTKEDIVSFYQIDPSQISVCYQSCHASFGQAVPVEGMQQVRDLYQLPPAYLLFVGSIIERKNLLNICKALTLLKGVVSLPLVVIGKGGDYKRKVEEYLQQQGLQHQVIFLSYQKGKALEGIHFPAIYQMAAMLIYPSFFEGFGIPVLEALWSKLPVITSNVSCLPEAGGDGAFYVNPSSPEDIANKIQLILSNTSLVQQRVESGFIYAQHFSNKNTAAKVWTVYESVLKD